MKCCIGVLAVPLLLGVGSAVSEGCDPQSDSENVRSNRGLIAFYDFADATGPVVRDRANAGQPLDLAIETPGAVRRTAGALTVTGKATIRSRKPAKRLIRAIQRTNALSIEAWVRPARIDQSGPARIVTLSKNPNERNFTLGQDKNRYEARFRATKTSTNGVPSVPSLPGSLKVAQTHVVFTRSKSGKVHVYLNGKPAFEGNADGDLSNWDGNLRFALANEIDGSRPWQGTLHLVAIYNRALTQRDVTTNFQAGPNATGSADQPMLVRADPKAIHFETKIAPLISHHCLECHDAGAHQGGLVLSRKDRAFIGGDSGAVIVKGRSADSLLWESVASDEMPHNRTPLSDEEKALLKNWIDNGATWSLDVIDPAIYAHGAGQGRTFVRRLTIDEYIETVRAAVGVDISKEARELLPADLRADGFSNTAYNLTVDLQHVGAYARLAETIVSRMDVPAFASRFGRKRNFTQTVMRPLIGRMGKWLYRSPLDDGEITSLRGITTTVASAGGNVDEAIGYVIEAMLQSPRFLYRIENQRGDGLPVYVDAFELASRMSYIVWGGPPDAELLQAAEEGNLDPAGVGDQLKRMLKDDRARQHARRFAIEWLNLARLENLSPNPQRFPKWKPELAADMRAETLAFFDEVVWQQHRPLADLLNAQLTFATPALAAHYGLRPQGRGLQRYDLSGQSHRGGLLTQGSVLTVGGDDASMVTRGLFVMHELLRGVVKDPPPCVDTTPKKTSRGITNRSVALERIANSACGGCHTRFEPLAFGLEKFDGLGAYHEQDEHGNALREDGQILFPGREKPVKYDSAARLMDLLAQSDRVRESITWKVTQFAVGRPLGAEDARILAKIHEDASKGGGTYESLMMAIVLSDLVQMTRTENDQ